MLTQHKNLGRIKDLEMESGDGFRTLGVQLMVNFMLCIFYHN